MSFPSFTYVSSNDNWHIFPFAEFEPSGAGVIALHDVQTGTSLVSFKQPNTAAHCTSYVETKNGLGGIVLTAQSDKALLNVFSFQKDQLVSKHVLPEKLCCIAVDSRGEYCAGGTSQGRLYLWQIASGILFNSFEAHYRQISVLRFTDDGAALVTAGEDSGVHVWSLSRMLDEDLQNDIPTPYCSFPDHTLPITDVLCGVGVFPTGRILTSSVDHSVKLWDLGTRSLLTSFLFPQSITVIARDPSERTFFAASQDGSIHQVNLFRRSKNATHLRSIESVSGGDMSEETRERLVSVGQPVTAMSFSMTSSWLMVGTSSGQIHIYDVSSHQLLRSINTYKDKGLSITSVATMLKPVDLVGHVDLAEGGATTKDAGPVRPVAPFQKTRNASARENHEVPILLPITDSLPLTLLPTKEEILEEHRYFFQTSGTVVSNEISLQSRVSELEAEVTKLKEQLGSAKGLNDSMWQNIVQKLLDKDLQISGGTTEETAERTRKRSRIVK